MSRGGVRTLYEWLTGAASPQPSSGAPGAPAGDQLPGRIGRYAIERKLGEGGMGVVYAARDDRLERTIALKTLPPLSDEIARQRLWREAKAAASVNHPNICQIYEIGEDAGRVFIAMELLDGEALAERLRRGPMGASEAVSVGLGMLAALSALHARGIVHRDLKPSNVFLTVHGVKLLDFGLARPEPDGSLGPAAAVTRTGTMMGTPRYMAPEQVTGDPIDARSDLFAAGATLFEMLAGRPAFTGRTVVDVLHATLHEQPPALTGSSEVSAVDRVIRRAMAKKPADRPESADAMAEELRAIRLAETGAAPALAHPLTRLVVLPFRVLRADPETDFLAFSLPDAIATSLSGNPSLIVRSSAVAGRFGADTPDLKALAAEADVDRVVMGTLLRAGDQLRAAAQLVEAPGGTLLTSHTVQSSMGDLFRLQDDIAGRVSEALALPLSGATASPTPDAPHDALGYEFYLRANELARTYDGLEKARSLYERCLELDPRFAPAWARLGRCHRVIGKYIEASADSESRAEDAFRRALALNPRLSIAHKFYANLEADIGHAQDAMTRLLKAADRHGNDPELFAGLVHACRYCGLYEQSIAAHAEARRLDPNVPTSLEQTLLMAGDIERLLTVEPPRVVAGADDGIHVIGLGLAGRREEAQRRLHGMRQASRIPLFQRWIEYLTDWLVGRGAEMAGHLSAFDTLKIHDDPEAVFQQGWLLCDVGEHQRGFEYLRRAVTRGYFAGPTLSNRPQFDALRSDPAFGALLEDAYAGRTRALAAFRDAGGERLIGPVIAGA
ncbi:MAG TPA: protein kinase [Vicinamibacterales bacterium]|nr:protein kinase [Vicinamibacterales bacterium]